MMFYLNKFCRTVRDLSRDLFKQRMKIVQLQNREQQIAQAQGVQGKLNNRGIVLLVPRS